MIPTLRRDLLAKAFGDDPVLIAAFEEQAEAVEQTSSQAAAAVESTSALQDATVLTLSANDVFSNERILTLGDGLESDDDGSRLTVSLSAIVPRINGGHFASFIVTAPTTLLLPAAGTLATLSGAETLSNKTMAQPKISTFGDFADDAAAAGGGVPVGGIYRTGSTLKVRVT